MKNQLKIKKIRTKRTKATKVKTEVKESPVDFFDEEFDVEKHIANLEVDNEFHSYGSYEIIKRKTNLRIYEDDEETGSI